MENIYETQENKEFVNKIVNYDSKLVKICTEAYNKYNVEFDINEEGDITLKPADDKVCESQNLLDAKEYVKSQLMEDEYNQILLN